MQQIQQIRPMRQRLLSSLGALVLLAVGALLGSVLWRTPARAQGAAPPVPLAVGGQEVQPVAVGGSNVATVIAYGNGVIAVVTPVVMPMAAMMKPPKPTTDRGAGYTGYSGFTGAIRTYRVDTEGHIFKVDAKDTDIQTGAFIEAKPAT